MSNGFNGGECQDGSNGGGNFDCPQTESEEVSEEMASDEVTVPADEPNGHNLPGEKKSLCIF